MKHVAVGLYMSAVAVGLLVALSGCATATSMGECRKLCLTEKVETFRDAETQCVCRGAE